MNLLSHKILSSQTTAPLHTLLLNFGKGRRQRDAEREEMSLAHLEMLSAAEMLSYQDPAVLERRTRELTVKQLATILRMQAEETDDVPMLNSLESLVLAGEISPADFVGRVQNLFPRAVATLDVSMRMKLAALVL